MSWCNYYYDAHTGNLLEDDYKSSAELNWCVPCAVEWEGGHKKIKRFTIDQNDELFKKQESDYYNNAMTFYSDKDKEKDEVLLGVMDKYKTDGLVIDIN